MRSFLQFVSSYCIRHPATPCLQNPLAMARHGVQGSGQPNLLEVLAGTAWGLVDLLPELGSLRVRMGN